MRKDSQGFSWLEIIIVLVVIILVAGIVVPSLWKSKHEINEGSAVRSVRMIVAAETNYAQAYSTGYSRSLSMLGPPADAMPSSSLAGYLDSELAAGAKEGYSFVYAPGSVDSENRIVSYTLTASPQKPGSTGKFYYFVDQTGVIRQDNSRVASAMDSPFGG